jgi:hypothetical protein
MRGGRENEREAGPIALRLMKPRAIRRKEGGHVFFLKKNMTPLLSPFVIFLFCRLSTCAHSFFLLNIEVRRVTGAWAGQVAGAECVMP